jgi:Xaa-Pro aminopeptidase
MNISRKNRERLANEIVNGAVLIHGNNSTYRNNDVAYPFRQDSNFHYLTEWPEPDAHAVIVVKDSKPELYLFVQDRNLEMETWDGKRIGQEGAVDKYNAKAAFSNTEYPKKLSELLKGIENIYCDYSNTKFQKYDQEALSFAVPYDQRGLDFSKATLHALSPILSELRLVKDKEEIDLLTKACDITVEGHKVAMNIAKAGMYEYQVAADMEKTFYDLGAERLGYPSIVASGDNACILHYSTNREIIPENSLLLIDAAGEYGMYSSDVTRTFPVNGRFSAEQKDVYMEVLRTQKLGIESVTTENTMQDIHQITVKSISESLVNLGLVPMGIDETTSMMHYFEYFMHGTGHWLGLDVHDAGSTEKDKEPRKLEPGMVTTIEPGIYIRPNKPVIEFPLLERDPVKIRDRRKEIGMEEATKLEQEEIKNAKTVKHEVPKNLLGIGVRIEDDIVCTKKEPINLTKGVPTSVEEIEAICS